MPGQSRRGGSTPLSLVHPHHPPVPCANSQFPVAPPPPLPLPPTPPPTIHTTPPLCPRGWSRPYVPFSFLFSPQDFFLLLYPFFFFFFWGGGGIWEGGGGGGGGWSVRPKKPKE